MHLVQHDIPTSIEPNYDIKLDIIYEDEDIIVLNKQSGLTVHPGAGTNNDTLLNAVIAHLGKIPYSHVRPGIVHRLDKDTSGLMVIAKNEEAHSFLSELLSNRRIKREYLAVVWGILPSNQGTIKTNIAPKRGNKEMMCVAKTTGKLAITHYSVQKVVGKASLVKCVLETGRTHQIRVHMSHMGHSIVGDQVYGKNSSKSAKYAKSSDFICSFNRQALHAYKLGLYHPKSKEYMDFCSDLPQDMRALIDEFEELTNYRNKKNYLTTLTNLIIIVLKLFIYLRNLCSGLMTKNLEYLASHCLNFRTMCTSRLLKLLVFKLKRAYKSFKTV